VKTALCSVDDLFAVPPALIELEAHPLGQIAGARTNPARRSFCISLAHETINRLAEGKSFEQEVTEAAAITQRKIQETDKISRKAAKQTSPHLPL
jgi:hypothetical protein